MPTSTLFSQAELPEDIPIMPGAIDLRVFEVTQGNMLTISFSVQASDVEIIEYYEQAMPANGWEKTGTYSDDKSQIVYFQKGGSTAMLMITYANGEIMVGISITQQ